MPKLPTMKDVAKAANVSVMTVSRSFKKDSSVSAETRERILNIAEEMGYLFDSVASNLRSQRSGFVAAIIPSINNANFADYLRAFSNRLMEEDLQVLLGYTDYDIQEEERLVEQLLRRRPEAIVIVGGQHTYRARRLLVNSGVPVVETWDLPPLPIEHVVGFSNVATMEPMIEHLISQGFKRIAFIGGDAERDTRGAERQRGAARALDERGMDALRQIAAGQPPIAMREGAEAMAKLLDSQPDTEAVICVSDLSAFGALTECMRRGVRVPEDIALAGFGAFGISGISVPTITTVDPHPRDIGLRSAELVISLLRGSEKEIGPTCIEIEPTLIVGESTG